MYSPTVYGSQWHCDISINGQIFRTGSQCGSLGQAQNTVAHVALQALLVEETVPLESILPADDPPAVKIENRTGTPICAATSTEAPAAQSSAQWGAAVALSGRGCKKKVGARTPPTLTPKAKKGKQKVSKKSRPNSNLIPLTYSRLVPLEELAEVVEDPLAALRNIQFRLGPLDSKSSYHSLMKSKCTGFWMLI